VSTVIAAQDTSEADLVRIAASAEMRSEHPLGKAIVAHAASQRVAVHEPQQFDYTPGRGITAMVDGSTILAGNRAIMLDHRIELPVDAGHSIEAGSQVFVARDGRFVGTVVVGDTVRPEAKRLSRCSIAWACKAFSLVVIRVGGHDVAAQLGITRVEANCFQKQKSEGSKIW